MHFALDIQKNLDGGHWIFTVIRPVLYGERTSSIVLTHKSQVKAKIVEIFKSIQGEGKYIGCLQTFIRLYGCNLRCAYCDTPLTKYTLYTAAELMQEVTAHKIPFISLTGGEPLLQAEFLREYLPQVKKEGFNVLLETNGTLPVQLKKVIHWIDSISCDLKLRSSTGQRALWAVHEKFFNQARTKEFFFKTVVTTHTGFRDVERAAKFMKGKEKYTVYLQPHTVKLSRTFLSRIISFQEYLIERGVDARIVPQIHKVLGIR